MRLTVNGETRELPPAATVADLVTAVGAPARGTAVAVDGTVVPRTAWDMTVLADGASVELVGAVQGG